MKLIKIGFALAVLLLAMSMASAIEYTKYTPPSMFNETHGHYAYEVDDFQFFINKFNDEEGEFDFYFNDSEGYTIVKGDTMGNYTATAINEVGAVELMELDGEKYIIECCYTQLDDSKHKDCWDALLEFNKQNNIKPLPING